MELSLLDLMSMQMGCAYLSDLRSLDKERRAILAHRLERMEAREEDLRDWNDALKYLANAPPEQTAQAAKERLVEDLNRPPVMGQPLGQSVPNLTI